MRGLRPGGQAQTDTSQSKRKSPRASRDSPHSGIPAANNVDHGPARKRQTSSMLGSVSASASSSMSRNSSESKTSPQSRHSTYSVSSCRETTRTLGCLQAVAIARGGGKTSPLSPNCIGFFPNFIPILVEYFYSPAIFMPFSGLWNPDRQRDKPKRTRFTLKTLRFLSEHA